MDLPQVLDSFRFLDLPTEIQMIIIQHVLVAPRRIMPLPPGKFSRTRRDYDLSPSILRVNRGLQSLCAPILYGQNEFNFSGTPGRDHMTIQHFESLVGRTNADLVRRVFLRQIPCESHRPLFNEASHTLAQTVPTFRFVVDVYGCALLRSFPNICFSTMALPSSYRMWNMACFLQTTFYLLQL